MSNNHPHGVRRTPHPNETVEAYTARMTVDENARKREAFAKFTATRGNVRTVDTAVANPRPDQGDGA